MPERKWPPPASAARAAPIAINSACCRRHSAGVVLFPAFPHRRQRRHAPKSAFRRTVASSVDKRELSVELDIQAGGNLESGVLEHLRAAAAAPRHDSLVARLQQ